LHLEEQLQELLRRFHRDKPAEPGLSREILRQRIGLPADIADWFLKESERKGLTVLWDEYVAAASHAAAHGQKSAQLRQLFEEVMDPRELVEVTPEWLAEKMQRQISEIKPFFEALTREGVLVRIAGVHVYRKTIQYIGAVIQQHFAVKPTLSVGEFRDLLNITRRLAVPLLEYLDAHKYTMRKEDVRLKGPNLTHLSE
jgi:selenocysteine-specific elongation factor